MWAQNVRIVVFLRFKQNKHSMSELNIAEFSFRDTDLKGMAHEF